MTKHKVEKYKRFTHFVNRNKRQGQKEKKSTTEKYLHTLHNIEN